MEPNGATQPNPQGEEGLEPIGDGQGAEGQGQEPHLYAGRFKTPEELEEHYKLSSTEGQRLAAENKRLMAIIQSAQGQAQPKAKPNPEVEDYENFFDKDTNTALERKIKRFITEYAQASKSESTFQKQVSDCWAETLKEYPELNDQNSELFQLADRILFERGLASRDEQNNLILATPYAYRIAVDAAYAQLSKQTPARQAAAVKKGQATAVSGRPVGTFTPTGRLTEEQYNKLSDEDKDKYDAWSIQQKNNRR